MTAGKLASSNDEAEFRARTWGDRDPFPKIPRALLSEAEIYDYALVTSMLHPFDPSALKSASYEAHIGGEFIFWDGEGKKQPSIVRRGDTCVLPANSISFVQVEPTFRLPNYIALRFNLRITHVHRGLLLGTGPLVDPGFWGKLLIPLHNLTSSDYDLDTTEALIWIEFTKTSYENAYRPPKDLHRYGTFRGFPDDKKNLSADKYLRKANGGNPIRSSIPEVVAVAKRRAESAETSARRVRNFVIGLGLLGSVGIGFGIYTVFTDTSDLVQGSVELMRNSETRVRGEIENLDRRLRLLEEKVNDLNDGAVSSDADSTAPARTTTSRP